jgi:outer membrane biogenesis lipoprotein LolB
MRLLSIIFVLVAVFLGCTKPPEAVPAKPVVPDAQKEDQYKKELEEIRKTLKGDIRIKLKKDGKGDFYSWEIDGKDVTEVLKANETLTKRLNGPQPGTEPTAPR